MRYSTDHKAETRKKVLREAAREIRAKGRENLAVARVMERAGLTHGGFYAHFASKDALVAEAVETMFEDARGRSEAIEQSGDPHQALLAYIDFYLSHAHRDRIERGCPLPTLSGEFARSDEPTRARFGRGVAALTDRLTRALSAIGADQPRAQACCILPR